MTEITTPHRKPPAAGHGRKKGSKNKIPRELKEMILTALSEVGGVDYLVARALDPKTQAAFLTLVGKVLPLQMTGAQGGPLTISVVDYAVDTGVPRSPNGVAMPERDSGPKLLN